MKKYSHAWLAFKAIERLQRADIPESKQEANEFIRWMRDHRDGLMKGAWYPDEVFMDIKTGHVLKFTPAEGEERAASSEFLPLPPGSQLYKAGKESSLYGKPYHVDVHTNLPARCEAWAHSIVDNLKIQETEERGSPIAPSDNHIATGMFILSHYIADAHMPFHCDSRPFSEGQRLHNKVEEAWEREIKTYFALDKQDERFLYDPDGYPLRTNTDYTKSFLKEVDEGLSTRPFSTSYGGKSTSVQEYMRAVCQYSYLLAYRFIPRNYNETNVDLEHWQSLPGCTLPFDRLSPLVFSEAIDAIARVWLRVWSRYTGWKKEREGEAAKRAHLSPQG